MSTPAGLTFDFRTKIEAAPWRIEWREERLVPFAEVDNCTIYLRRFYPGDGSVEIRLRVETRGYNTLRPTEGAELAERLAAASRLAASLQEECRSAICRNCGRHLYDLGVEHSEGCPRES